MRDMRGSRLWDNVLLVWDCIRIGFWGLVSLLILGALLASLLTSRSCVYAVDPKTGEAKQLRWYEVQPWKWKRGG